MSNEKSVEVAAALRRYADEIETRGAPEPSMLVVHNPCGTEPRDSVRNFLAGAGMDFSVKCGPLGDVVVRQVGALLVELWVPEGTVTTTVPSVVEEPHVPSNPEILGKLYGAGR